MTRVTMTCMTTKQKFDVEDPEVIVLRNGRYAYKCKCPWEGKNGKVLYAFKFASARAYDDHKASTEQQEAPESPKANIEQNEAPKTPQNSDSQ